MVTRRLGRRRREVSGSMVLQLACGWDFFGGAFGNGDDCDLEAMAKAWADPEIRKRVYARVREKWGPEVAPFGEIAFDKMNCRLASDLAYAAEEYSQQRKTLSFAQREV